MSDKKWMRPESLMMSYGYKPELSEGAVKCPIFQTSTFVFKKAAEGKAFFELAYGLREPNPGEESGLIYSRLNNPDMEILEQRLTLWDKSEACAVFSSGMGAITTTMMEMLRPGDLVLFSSPLYGGTDHFIHHVLPIWGVDYLSFDAFDSREKIMELIASTGKIPSLIYVETPSNPTNTLIDLEMCNSIAKHFSTAEKKVHVAVDNTYMGPLWCHPLEHGVDLVLYSATKYIGGHSDVIAGAVLGSKALIQRIKGMRTFFGNVIDPMTCWLLMRSLETLKPRMMLQATNAEHVAKWLDAHPKVEKVYFPVLIKKEDPQFKILERQYKSHGAMLSFDIKGGEKEAFAFLDNLQLIKLAVSLGSTESLAEHPATMTHADVSVENKKKHYISEKLVRISIGVEYYEDIIWDISQALDKVV
ncbi:MAG: cystathionine gamma-synthase family protein [Bacteroidetes bacterium]|nr:cystathionine gamma-synthase family protein [Bacteroidota bacterium]